MEYLDALRERNQPLILALLALAVATGLILGTNAQVVSNPAQTPINLTIHNDRPNIDTPSEMCTSVLVADITVSGLGKARWNTANGQRVANVTRVDVDTKGYTIYTPLTFSSQKPLLDRRTLLTVEYVLKGGQVGSDSLTYSDYPWTEPGKRYIAVFVPTLQQETQTFSQASLDIFSAFEVTSDNRVILKRRTVEQGQVSQEEVSMSIGELTSALSQCK